MIRQLTLCLATAALAVAGSSASAAILAQDSYIVGPGEYTAGGLNAQTGASSVGFSAPWSVNSANLQVEAGGILDGDADTTLPSNGQGKFLSAPGAFSANFRRADRLLAAPAPAGSTYYMSHLLNAGSSTGPNQNYAFVGFGGFVAQQTIEGTANNLFGAFTGFVGDGAGGVDLVVRSRTGAAAGGIGTTVLVPDAANTTFNVVMALEFNNPGDTVRYWVNPTDFANGEAGLTASSTINGAIPGFQLSAVSDMARLSIMTAGFDRSLFWDESILADTVADLRPVPEPTTLLLAVLAIGAVVRRVR
ncbi:hypothetical protein Pla108_39190 [Botrimarina colliarenosi]|uniref:PEP-CTERM protein-sorting domain-containing protein n=1 Tax=Botrimarina colliarenosi TaxID=2528001 RepID=A0A5C6A1Y9_9BACT|nr:hypothetical protein [Botrimarina colliarenosi]TWT93425.1 hypothetical protein Pla108_39190 [Botrimarina colliarenosi]